MENTNVQTAVATTTTAPKGKRGVRPAVQERKARILDALKSVLADGKPRGPSDIARELNAAGFTTPEVWTDAYHMLKGGVHFGVTYVEGAKRARYFLPVAVAEVVQPETAPAIEELNAELAGLVQGLEEPASVIEPEAPVAEPVAQPAPKKSKKGKKADAPPAAEADVVEEAKAA